MRVFRKVKKCYQLGSFNYPYDVIHGHYFPPSARSPFFEFLTCSQRRVFLTPELIRTIFNELCEKYVIERAKISTELPNFYYSFSLRQLGGMVDLRRDLGTILLGTHQPGVEIVQPGKGRERESYVRKGSIVRLIGPVSDAALIPA